MIQPGDLLRRADPQPLDPQWSISSLSAMGVQNLTRSTWLSRVSCRYGYLPLPQVILLIAVVGLQRSQPTHPRLGNSNHVVYLHPCGDRSDDRTAAPLSQRQGPIRTQNGCDLCSQAVCHRPKKSGEGWFRGNASGSISRPKRYRCIQCGGSSFRNWGQTRRSNLQTELPCREQTINSPRGKFGVRTLSCITRPIEIDDPPAGGVKSTS